MMYGSSGVIHTSNNNIDNSNNNKDECLCPCNDKTDDDDDSGKKRPKYFSKSFETNSDSKPPTVLMFTNDGQMFETATYFPVKEDLGQTQTSNIPTTDRPDPTEAINLSLDPPSFFQVRATFPSHFTTG
jgi:hypothetical protein